MAGFRITGISLIPGIPITKNGKHFLDPDAAEHIFRVSNSRKVVDMLNAAVLFLIIALVAAVLGFGGIAGTAAGIAKILFFVFLVLALISFLTGRRGTAL
jgi:uncharacterized membrane protein YtjA (UPF0391 family)